MWPDLMGTFPTLSVTQCRVLNALGELETGLIWDSAIRVRLPGSLSEERT